MKGHEHNLPTPDDVTRFGSHVTNGDIDKVKKFLMHYPQMIDAPVVREKTPVIAAIEARQQEMVIFLLEQGASTEIRDEASGLTPLTWAISERKIVIVEALIKHGADVNAKTSKGITPLLVATIFRQKAVVGMLLERGASTTGLTSQGETALEVAEDADMTEIADLIRPHDAELKTRAQHSVRVNVLQHKKPKVSPFNKKQGPKI